MLLPDTIARLLCPAWDTVWLFSFAFFLAGVLIFLPERGELDYQQLRVPYRDLNKTGGWLALLTIAILVALSPMLGAPEYCCGDYYPMPLTLLFDSPVLTSSAGVAVALLLLHLKYTKAKRALYCLMRDGVADGTLRAVIMRERQHSDEWVSAAASKYKWAIYDMHKTKDIELQWFAECAVNANSYESVCIVFNISVEEVMQRLKQYGLMTKRGYERLPAADVLSHKIPPPGGSVLQFYYCAEYVRVWG